jgi:hypothetical protein
MTTASKRSSGAKKGPGGNAVATHKTGSRQRREARQKVGSDVSKSDFFAAVGHTPESHVLPKDPTAAGRWLAFVNARAEAGGLSHPMPDHCGWWWCAHADHPSTDWVDLLAALNDLKARGIDPWGVEVAHVAGQHPLTRKWAAEHEGYDALKYTLSTLSVEGDADRLRRKWLKELAPLARHARQSVALSRQRGPRRDLAQANAIRVAKGFSLGLEEVAAVFLLTGVATGSLKDIRRAVKAIAKRNEMLTG